MKDRIYITDAQIEKVTYHITSLSQAEREEVRALLNRLQSDGIGRQELHRELARLRKSYALSDIDIRAIEDALFGR
ncbi:hypothetical protein HY478_01500 [Candidatus Uhrbacteria bacterium]|nr:hypothetical protein [Candidatus Uhrbacteria bacterium]